MGNETPATDLGLPSYLSGSLLLRGRSRVIATVCVVGAYFVLTPILRHVLGNARSASAALTALALAWLWGRSIGAVAGFVGIVGNVAWGAASGVGDGIDASIAVDAILVGLVAALVGHVAKVLDRAVGAGARSYRAYTELEQMARDRMLTITDQVPVGLYRSTPEGRIIDGNEALLKILGFADREAMLRANAWNLYVDPEVRMRQLDERETDQGHWREFQLRRDDGEVIWARDWSRAIRDEDGEISHFDGVLEDMTSERLADASFRAAFADSPIGMTIGSADGRIVRANAAAATLLGRSEDEVAGVHFTEFTAEEDIAMTEQAMQDVMAGTVVTYEAQLVRPDGSSVWALTTLAPIEHSAKRATSFLSHALDVTERRRAQESLEALIRSKDELIASVSHELRTPLTVVHGLANELNSGWSRFSVVEQKEFIDLIAQQSDEVVFIVEDLLVAARADIGKLPIHAQSIDIQTQIEAALAAVSGVATQLEMVGDAVPAAFADPTRVRQIVRNLVSNADRYGGDQVKITYGGEDDVVWVEVADNGDGIPEADAAKVFEAYQRAHNAEGQPGSVGLGLTVSLRLAELMGGSLAYRYEDQRAIFRLELPVFGAVHAATSVR